jgi:FdhD protein
MGVPVVASRTSPTDMAIALAAELNVTVCGYVRPDGLNLYTGAGCRTPTRSRMTF